MRITKNYLLEQLAECQTELLVYKTELLGRYHGTAQDVDSIKHQIRFILSRLDTLISNWKIIPPPDILDETLNPSKEFLDKIISEARFVPYGTSEASKKKVRKKRRAKK